MEKTLKKYFVVFTIPTVLAFILAFVAPFIIGLYLSFCEFQTVADAKWVGLKNYEKIFIDGKFVDAFWFTALFAIVAVVAINIFAFSIALMLTRNVKGTNIFRTVFFMPNLIGGIVLGYVWQSMINAVLYNYGQTIVNNPKFGFVGLVILINWQMIGYMMIIYIAGLQNVPTELKEAARIDGATWWQTLTKVTIPMVMPSITICLFLTVSNCFKLFDQNLALTAGAPSDKTTMLALDIFKTFYNRVGFEGVGQAKAVIFFVLVAVIALVQLKLTRSKEVEQ